jgi:hypothetical protein
MTIMTRKPGISREAFADYWTNVHAPLLASHPAVKRLVINVTEQFVRFSVRNEDPADPLRSTIVTQIPTVRRAVVRRPRIDGGDVPVGFSRRLVADAEHFVGASRRSSSRSGDRR